MVNQLTPEQEALFPVIREKWIKKLTAQDFDENKCRESVAWLYEFCGYAKPEILFCESPLAAQRLANKLCKTEKTFYDFAIYGNIGDYGWCSFYDFFTEIGMLQNDDFQKFVKLLDSGVYDMIQFDTHCIVCKKPTIMKFNEARRLHSSSGPAVRFTDGFELWFWNGVSVPKEWIEDPKCITKEMYMAENNAEMKRTMFEIIGQERYAEIMDLLTLDEDTDDQGNPMVLYRTKEIDPVAQEMIYILKVVCNSTGRIYHITVPECKNVWDAKAWTFENEKIQIRHGDVGLVNLSKACDKPEFES